MQTYRLATEDGPDHLIRIVGVDEDEIACETVHRADDLECRMDQCINRCVFEQLLALGYIVPVSS